MEQIIVKHLDGSTTALQSKERGSTITRATQSVELLNKDVVEITIVSGDKLTFGVGDKIEVLGRDYSLNIPARETKLSEYNFRYDLQFEGKQYDLARATYDVNLDTTGSDLKGDSLTGDLKMFLDVLMLNIARVFPGKWTLGAYPQETETMTLTFGESDNCLSVLQNLCGVYNQEFEIDIDPSGACTLHIRTAGKDFTYTFEYGKGRGLYELTRDKVSSSNIVNRLKVYGSTRNITTKYRSTRLCLPGKNKSESYIEDQASIAKFGVWENTKIFEDVFPHRKGTVTAIDEDSVLKFIDATMDFDLNEKEADGVTTKYLLSGTSVKVKFNTGNLAGYEFELKAYDHSVNTFTLIQLKDERDMSFPSDTSPAFQFAVGDEYVLLDISLPQPYEAAQETKLEEKGSEYLSQNSQPKVQYSLTVDSDFLRDMVGAQVDSNLFWAGDYIPIKDSDIEVDKAIRVKGFERDLMKDLAYTLTISDLTVTRTQYNRVISDLIDIDKIIRINHLKDPARARRNWLAAQELYNMVFDPEGDYYSEKIKPLSIETTMLSVGAKSMQFGLVGTVFQPNFNGDANHIIFKGGTLVHYTIDPQAAKMWTLTDGDITLLSEGSPYYIYAKVERVGSGGTFIFTADQKAVESETGYYHFWVGVISSVDSSLLTRLISLTYGFTTINGRHIKTGRISSSGDGTSYFDLDSEELVLGESLKWNINGDGKLRLKGAIIQSEEGQESVIVVYRGAYNPSATYYKGDVVSHNGSTWAYINAAPSAGNSPAENSFWTLYVSKGDAGDSKSVILTPTKQVFSYNSNGTLKDSGAWFLTTQVFGVTGTIYYEWKINNVAVQNDIYSAYLLAPPNSYNSMPVKYEVIIRQGSTSGMILASDTVTIFGVKDPVDGEPAFTIVLSNETHAVPSDSAGVVSSYNGSGTDIRAWLGATPLAYGSGALTFDVTASGASINPGTPSTVSTYTRRYGNHSSMNADQATVTYTIKVRNAVGSELTIVKTQTLSKAKSGAAGSAGPAVVSQGQWSASATYYGDTTRVDVVRTGSAGSYIWYKAKTTAGSIPAGTAVTNATYWEAFGGTFQSIATGTLFAEGANVGEFIFKGGKLISQRGTLYGSESTDYMNANFVPYITIDGTTGNVTFKKATIEGALNAGSVGGFTIANERIGALSDANGLSILSSLIKFYNSSVNVWAGIGENVLPSSSGLRALGRFDNNQLQGYYQQQFSHYDYYYSEQDWYNAGSPQPANWVYDEWDQLSYIEVSVYAMVLVPSYGSINYGIIASAEGAETNIALEAVKGKIKATSGGVVSWDTDYIGQAYTDILESKIHLTNHFMFTAIGSSLLTVRLPSSSHISAKTTKTVTFLLCITISVNTSNAIRLTSVNGGWIRDNNGNAVSYIDMYKGDTIILRYHNGAYYRHAILQ